MPESIADKLRFALDLDSKISFETAKEKIPKLSRSNYDKIKHDWRKKNNTKFTKKSKKSKKVEPGKKDRSEPDETQYRELTSDRLETLIVEALDENPHDTSMIRAAVDYYCKIKLAEGESVDELDMSKFYKIGQELKKNGQNNN